MKITDAVSRAINQGSEHEWSLIFSCNNGTENSGFMIDQQEVLKPAYKEEFLIADLVVEGARNGMALHNLI